MRVGYTGFGTEMASLDTKWLHAQLNLAWRVVIHYARFLWPWRKRFGLERFKENYVHEGLPPATRAYRDLAHEAGRCTVCGACDQTCPLLRERAEGEFLGPMRMAISAARAAPHLEDAAGTLRTMAGPECAGCRRCDEACPEDIPLIELARVLVDQLEVIEQARQAAGPKALPAGRPAERS